MSDVKRYTEKRKLTDADFADGFEVGYANFVSVISYSPQINGHAWHDRGA